MAVRRQLASENGGARGFSGVTASVLMAVALFCMHLHRSLHL